MVAAAPAGCDLVWFATHRGVRVDTGELVTPPLLDVRVEPSLAQPLLDDPFDRVVAGAGDDHGRISADLGKPDEPGTKALWAFPDGALNE
ncbi:MAG: hypothetical protein K2X87_03720 [Gemmataceae bacterium]|nr:hypothetical protein [Gemmataceae bacterium]